MISSSANQSLAYPKEYKEYDNSWVLCLTVASDYNYMKSLYGQSIERKYWNEKFDKSFVVPRVTIKRDKTTIKAFKNDMRSKDILSWVCSTVNSSFQVIFPTAKWLFRDWQIEMKPEIKNLGHLVQIQRSAGWRRVTTRDSRWKCW
jgi:hypothetical protein